jgi:hypothetical protein
MPAFCILPRILMTDRKKNSASDPTPWQNFESAMRHIISVPHAKIKAHLDAEKEAKKFKRTRKARYRAFREVNRDL